MSFPRGMKLFPLGIMFFPVGIKTFPSGIKTFLVRSKQNSIAQKELLIGCKWTFIWWQEAIFRSKPLRLQFNSPHVKSLILETHLTSPDIFL